MGSILNLLSGQELNPWSVWFIFDRDYLRFMKGEKLHNEKYDIVYNIYNSIEHFSFSYFEKRKEVYFCLSDSYNSILNLIHSNNNYEKQIAIISLAFIHDKMYISKKLLAELLNTILKDNYVLLNAEEKSIIFCISLSLSMICLYLKDKDLLDLILMYSQSENYFISSLFKYLYVIANNYNINKESIIFYINKSFMEGIDQYLINQFLKSGYLETNINYEFFRDIDFNSNLLSQFYKKVYNKVPSVNLVNERIETRLKDITLSAQENNYHNYNLYDIYEVLCYVDLLKENPL